MLNPKTLEDIKSLINSDHLREKSVQQYGAILLILIEEIENLKQHIRLINGRT